MNSAQRDGYMADCAPLVRRIVSRIRPPDECHDSCVQAGYLAVLEVLEGWDQADVPYPTLIKFWIKPRVTREVYREIERNQTEDDIPVHELASSEDSDDATTDEALLVDDVANELLLKRDNMIEAIIDLRDKVARNLMLHVLEGDSVSEGGRQLGLSQSAADRLYQRTVLQLREKLSG